MIRSGFSRRTVPLASSSEENMVVENWAASRAALSGTAVSKSSMVMRICEAMLESNARTAGSRE
jgi:hypothetical protein